MVTDPDGQPARSKSTLGLGMTLISCAVGRYSRTRGALYLWTLLLRTVLALAPVLGFLADTGAARAEDAVALNTKSQKYHRLSCPWAQRRNANWVILHLAEAIARGGFPCKVCAPPAKQPELHPLANIALPENLAESASRPASDRLATMDKPRTSPGEVSPEEEPTSRNRTAGRWAAYGRGPKHKPNGAKGPVILNGIAATAWWSDGDSFKMSGGSQKEMNRVVGYNTLETFGPVHRWGTWDPAELLILAKRAAAVAASRARQCVSIGKKDLYQRDLVRCPSAARDLVAEGLAMVFAIDETPDQELVDLQAAAEQQGRGIWARGVPESILTSVHSADEDRRDEGTTALRSKATTYNRIVDPRTGVTRLQPHDKVFRTCENVCDPGGPTNSCMIYVPFERRYRDKPPCLR